MILRLWIPSVYITSVYLFGKLQIVFSTYHATHLHILRYTFNCMKMKTSCIPPAAVGVVPAFIGRILTSRYLTLFLFPNYLSLSHHVPTVLHMSNRRLFVLLQVKFYWGTGAITPYGRDYVSAQWVGKLMGPSTETFTLYLRADDAARLYIDHELVIDAWEGNSPVFPVAA